MTKSLAAIATAVLAAATLLSSGAEAGFRVGIGFGGGVPPYLTDYNKQSAYDHKPARKRYRAARRQESAPVRATKKKASPSVAKVETEAAPATAAQKAAETENSSISLAKVDAAPAKAAEPVTTAEAIPSDAPATQLDCKKFFPSVGLTLTVPCE